LSELTPYLALAILPVAVSIPLEPISFLWGWKHRFEPMPPDVAEKSERFRRYAFFPGDLVAIVLVLFLTLRNSVTISQLGLSLASWERKALIGCGLGMVWIGLDWSVTRIAFPTSRPRPSLFQKGPVSLWIVIFLSGSFAEELWRALCIIALKETAHSKFFIVTVTALVFSIAHIWGGGLVRTLGKFPFGVAAAVAFIWTGSLLTTCVFHFMANVSGLYWTRRRNRGQRFVPGG